MLSGYKQYVFNSGLKDIIQPESSVWHSCLNSTPIIIALSMCLMLSDLTKCG